ncbi:MAG: hypothetical protein WBC53_11240, partial [Phycisphaerae bacterium]
DNRVVRGFWREVGHDGKDWAPLGAGLFDGSLEVYKRVSTEYIALLKNTPEYRTSRTDVVVQPEMENRLS